VVIGEGCVATFPYDHGSSQRPLKPHWRKHNIIDPMRFNTKLLGWYHAFK
jgi:hypothetical protein